MSTLTLDAGANSNGYRYTASTTFANARSGADGTGGTTAFLESYFVGSNNYENGRHLLYFDSSSIPVGSIINSLTLRVPAVANFENANTCTLHVVSYSGSGAVGAGDYTSIGSTSFGSVLFSGLSGGGTTDITLDANGIAAFTAGGETKYALITDRDLNNSAPTGGNAFTVTIANYDLIVDYTPPDAGGFFYMSY